MVRKAVVAAMAAGVVTGAVVATRSRAVRTRELHPPLTGGGINAQVLADASQHDRHRLLYTASFV